MSGKTNRRRGNNYELQIVKELKDLGFEIITENKNKDKNFQTIFQKS